MQTTTLDSQTLHRRARARRARHFAILLRRSSRRLARFLTRRVLGAVPAYFQRRREAQELMGMDDRMLRDMGVTRGAIFHALDFGRHAANTNEPLKGRDAA